MTTRQRVIVAMIDGLDPRYATAQAMPAFSRLAAAGTSALVEAVMPTVTNANNAGNQALDRRGAPVRLALSAEKDRYVRHHRTFGGTAWVWLNDGRDEDTVAATLAALPGMEAVLTRSDAARRFRLHPGRIGDLVVRGDVDTVFGDLPPGTESEALPAAYRSHGSLHERQVPLAAYNNQTLPYPSMPGTTKTCSSP
jgi:phosphonoacetate hydrolase